MDLKYKRILETLLESGKLNDFENKAFQSMYDKDNQYGGTSVLSMKQKNWIGKKKLELIDGITDKKEIEQKLEAPTEYENAKVILVQGEGFRIEANGVVISVPVTKTEGIIIACWLSKALPEIIDMDTDEEIEDIERNEVSEEEVVEETTGSNDPF